MKNRALAVSIRVMALKLFRGLMPADSKALV